jgi:hypothetical protein
MRRSKCDPEHGPPYLEDLIAEANPPIQALRDFEMSRLGSFTRQTETALEQLWSIFQSLSYQGRSRNGLAGAVGISKAVLLLTEGRVGPAFDSEVPSELGIRKLENADQWILALKVASRDIHAFETANQCTLQEAAPIRFAAMQSGRIYDLALGPG